MNIQASGKTDTGRSRPRNDDCFLVDAELGLYIACDGVSGQAGASEASQTASLEVNQYWKNQRDLLAKYRDVLTCPERDSFEPARDTIRACLNESVASASLKIFNMGRSDPSRYGMATTIEVALVIGNFVFVAHVGDSRTYLIRGEKLYQVTSDHSFVNQMVQSGQLSREEAERSPYSHVITRALGAQEIVAVDVLDIEMAPGDSFLLCTDGLYRYFTDQELVDRFGKESAKTLPETLIRQANERGGADNLTAVVLKVGLEDSQRYTQIMEKLNTLGTFPLFSYLSSNELLQILRLAKIRNLNKGQVVLKEGDFADNLFIILRGSVEVIKGDQVIATRGKGESIGEMGWADYSPRSATVICDQDSRFLVIPRNSLYQLFTYESKLAVKFFWSLCSSLNERLRAATDRLAVVQKSLMDDPGPLPFYIDDKTKPE